MKYVRVSRDNTDLEAFVNLKTELMNACIIDEFDSTFCEIVETNAIVSNRNSVIYEIEDCYIKVTEVEDITVISIASSYKLGTIWKPIGIFVEDIEQHQRHKFYKVN